MQDQPCSPPYGQQVRPNRDEPILKQSSGYVMVFLPEHPASNKWGWVKQHRIVMEGLLGRYLGAKEEVHHVNGDKSDNRPENLMLFPNRSAHMKWHKLHEAKRYDPEVIERVRVAAKDPKATASSLGLAHRTIQAICRENGIVWLSASRKYIPEQTVIEALRGRSTAQAAKILGVALEWLYRNHPDKIQKRNRPRFLDDHREEICNLAKTHSLWAIGKMFGTPRQTVANALARWGVSLDESDVRGKQSRAKRGTPRTASGRFCASEEPGGDQKAS